MLDCIIKHLWSYYHCSHILRFWFMKDVDFISFTPGETGQYARQEGAIRLLQSTTIS
jgi:hypothetical protein